MLGNAGSRPLWRSHGPTEALSRRAYLNNAVPLCVVQACSTRMPCCAVSVCPSIPDLVESTDDSIGLLPHPLTVQVWSYVFSLKNTNTIAAVAEESAEPQLRREYAAAPELVRALHAVACSFLGRQRVRC